MTTKDTATLAEVLRQRDEARAERDEALREYAASLGTAHGERDRLRETVVGLARSCGCRAWAESRHPELFGGEDDHEQR